MNNPAAKASGMSRVDWIRLTLATALCVLLGLLASRIFDQVLWQYLAIPPFLAVAVIATRPLALALRSVLLVAATLFAVGFTSWSTGGSPLNLVPLGAARRLITTEWPSPSDPTVIALVGLLLAVATVVTLVLSISKRWHLLPLAIVLITGSAFVTFSARSGPPWTIIGAGGALSILFALYPHGIGARERSATLASDRGLILAVLFVIGAVFASLMLFRPSERRSDPRRLQDPDHVEAIVDPIEATIALNQLDPPIDLFRVTNRSILSGRELPAHWRLTALTEYDGQRWAPRSTLVPIGGRLNSGASLEGAPRPPLTYDLAVLTDDLDILPFPGAPLTVSANVSTDVDRVIVQLRARPTPGATIRASSDVQPTRNEAIGHPVAQRAADEISSSFADVATQIAGEGNDLERLSAIQSTLHEGWSLDPTATGAGQQQALIDRFVRETHRGTREQFVTAFVLLARSIGFDSRVATGFILPPDAVNSPAQLTSKDAAIWPEVLIEGVGWVRFDPVPPDVAPNQDQPIPPRESQSPAAAQPPIAPPADEPQTRDDDGDPQDEGGARWLAVVQRVARIAMNIGIGLSPLLLTFGGILGYKALRRRRRLRAADPKDRVRGAWANTTDELVDAGLTIPRSWSNEQIADAGVPLAVGSKGELQRLAMLSNTVTFGDDTPDDETIDDAIKSSDRVHDHIRSQLSRGQRVRWRLSLRSIRKTTRSPVLG